MEKDPAEIHDDTRRFARFAVETGFDDLPAEAVHGVRRSFLDWIGVAIAGLSHATTQSAQRAIKLTGGPGPYTVIGQSETLDLSSAVLLNGVTGHVLDWDDAVYPTRIHPSGALIPGILGAGELSGATGKDAITALAVGFEITWRLAEATYPDLQHRNWHSTGVAGAPAAGAAVGRLLGLDEDQTVWALGLGAGLSAGTQSALGSSAKSFIPAHAAVSGVQSAYLAREGYSSHPNMLGPAGRYLDLYCDNPRYEGLTDGLGSAWAVANNGFKAYPCGMVAHAGIDAVRDLRNLAPPGSKLDQLLVHVSEDTLMCMGNLDPRTGLQGKFSVRYETAVAWVDGDVTPTAFEDDSVLRADYREALERTTVTGRDDIEQHEAYAEVRTVDGWEERIHITFARGTPERPMTDEDLEAKFYTACEIGGWTHPEKLAELIWNLEDSSVAELAAMLKRTT